MIRRVTALLLMALAVAPALAPAYAQAPPPAALTAVWSPDRATLTITWSAPEVGCLAWQEAGSRVRVSLQQGKPCAPTGQSVLTPGGDQGTAAVPGRRVVLLATDGQTVLAETIIPPRYPVIVLPLIVR